MSFMILAGSFYIYTWAETGSDFHGMYVLIDKPSDKFLERILKWTEFVTVFLILVYLVSSLLHLNLIGLVAISTFIFVIFYVAIVIDLNRDS